MRILEVLIGAAIASAAQAALASPTEPPDIQATPVSIPEAAAEPPAQSGRQVYNAVCIACHAAPGIGGAPALGDIEAWTPRLAQGADTLIDHAVNGFSGSTGLMPRKGGRLDLTDEEVARAVDYMIEQAVQ